MEQRELNVTTRAEKGKGSARRIRREGKIPAVLYGRKIEPSTWPSSRRI